MGNDIPGKFIGLLLAFILMVIMPFVTVTIEGEMLDRRLIVDDVCTFVDSVVDSRQVSDADVEQLNLALASYGVTVDYEITHYKMSVNPDPISKGSYYITYVKMNPDSVGVNTYDQGDKISVHVKGIGYSTTETLAHKLSGMFVKNLDFTITARIR